MRHSPIAFASPKICLRGDLCAGLATGALDFAFGGIKALCAGTAAWFETDCLDQSQIPSVVVLVNLHSSLVERRMRLQIDW